MRVIIQNSQRQLPQSDTFRGYGIGYGQRSITEFLARDNGVEFDIRMISESGFYLPVDCDIDMEIKFTIIPKPQSPQVKVFK